MSGVTDEAVRDAALAYAKYEFDGELPDGCDWGGLSHGRREGMRVALDAAYPAIRKAVLAERGVADVAARGVACDDR